MTLLPANATDFEIALEHALSLITEIPNPIDTLWDPWKCPAQFLPWLAWQFSVDYWRTDWPETVKRQVVSVAYEVHRIKGTLPAIRQGIAGLGIEADIVRWFETEPKGAPYTMTVTALARPASDGRIVLDAAGQQDLREVIDANKALRTDYGLRIASEHAVGLYVAGVATIRVIQTVDCPTENGLRMGVAFAAVASVLAVSTFEATAQ